MDLRGRQQGPINKRAEEPVPRRPIEELRDAVDLTVVLAVRKGEQLVQEAAEPIVALGQMDMAGFDRGRLRRLIRLAVLRLATDRRGMPSGNSRRSFCMTMSHVVPNSHVERPHPIVK